MFEYILCRLLLRKMFGENEKQKKSKFILQILRSWPTNVWDPSAVQTEPLNCSVMFLTFGSGQVD